MRLAVKSAQRLPPSLLAALPFNIACKPILLSDPARAVLHSARSAGEISEVLCSRHRRKSHRLTERKAVLPIIANLSLFVLYLSHFAFNMHHKGAETLTNFKKDFFFQFVAFGR